MNSISKTRIREIKTIERLQPTILQAECSKETITAYLSDGRIITIPTWLV